MREPVAIAVERLGKRFRLGPRATTDRFTERLQTACLNTVRRPWQWLRGSSRPTAPTTAHRDEYWALDDISFEVRQGEALGIVGRNGAGKSTLLKILTRITEPTRGRFGIRGRVASLLEVGTGFHPDLTGRENIYLSGAFLGMSRQEIRRRFDEIVAFAEIDAFIDTSVKRYSSGMYTRLGFAVAAHLESEVLIVDEVLAVGDAAFQKKCLGKMQDTAQQGRTVLFVSHNMLAVQTLCSRAIWLDGGSLRADDTPAAIQQTYQRATDSAAPSSHLLSASADGLVRVRSASARPIPINAALTVQSPVEIVVDYDIIDQPRRLHVCLYVFDSTGACAFCTFSEPSTHPPGHVRATCTIPGNLLNAGTYAIDVQIVEQGTTVIVGIRHAIVFDVLDADRTTSWLGTWSGAVRPACVWQVSSLDKATRT
ncbi:MAG: ABC transporter ATP-binding protein [Planctomycetaceae bacterium]|nr:ABC transporter ATP-binding protein [Planctomycetaceae bacterium]